MGNFFSQPNHYNFDGYHEWEIGDDPCYTYATLCDQVEQAMWCVGPAAYGVEDEHGVRLILADVLKQRALQQAVSGVKYGRLCMIAAACI